MSLSTQGIPQVIAAAKAMGAQAGLLAAYAAGPGATV